MKLQQNNVVRGPISYRPYDGPPKKQFTLTVYPERASKYWFQGTRGSATIWVEFAPEWITMYQPGFAVGDRVDWNLFEIDPDRMSRILSPHEIARIVGRADVYDEASRGTPTRAISAIVVGIGHVYSTKHRGAGPGVFVWKQRYGYQYETFLTSSGVRFLPEGMLVDVELLDGE